jgi:hypothetical protein
MPPPLPSSLKVRTIAIPIHRSDEIHEPNKLMQMQMQLCFSSAGSPKEEFFIMKGDSWVVPKPSRRND